MVVSDAGGGDRGGGVGWVAVPARPDPDDHRPLGAAGPGRPHAGGATGPHAAVLLEPGRVCDRGRAAGGGDSDRDADRGAPDLVRMRVRARNPAALSPG